MSTKPILFSTPMVQAILDGRKTMTRRVIKPQLPDNDWSLGFYNPCRVDKNGEEYPDAERFGIWGEWGAMWDIPAKYQPGDILWVRETWAYAGTDEQNNPEFYYKADGEAPDYWYLTAWKPSIFMPRAAARIFLRVTDVRVERLQDILCGDMKKEGCIPITVTGGQYQQWQRDYFIPLWHSTIKKSDLPRYGWETNPWVWVYEFERKGEDNS